MLMAKMVDLKKCKEIADANKDKETSGLIENQMKVVDYHLKDPSLSQANVSTFRVG